MNVDRTPQLEVDGRTLEPLRVEHAEEMAVVLGDPALHIFIGGEPPTIERLRRRYAAQVAGDPSGEQVWHNWVVRDRAGNPVGYVQATVARDNAEVAWVVGAGHQGKGHATVAATAMTAWLREVGVTRLVAHVHRDHLASSAIAQRIGLAPTGRLVDGEVEWASDAHAAEPTVGPAPTQDPQELLAFWRVAAEDTGRPTDTVAAVERLFDRDPEALIVAHVGEVLVGTVVAGFDGWRCHLYRLAVHPTWRGGGIGRDLVRAGEDRFRGFGATRADAMVLDANAEGRAMWTALGYAPQDDWSRWVKPLRG